MRMDSKIFQEIGMQKVQECDMFTQGLFRLRNTLSFRYCMAIFKT